MKKKKMEKPNSDFFRGAGPAYNSKYLDDLRKVLVRDDGISRDEFTDFVTFGYIFTYQYIPMDALKQIVSELYYAGKVLNKIID